MKRSLPFLLTASLLAFGPGIAAAQQPSPAPAPERPRPAPAPRGVAPTAAAGAWLGLALDYQREGRDERGREIAVLRDLYPNSPAARAGLQRGDHIVRVNGGTDVQARIRALRLQPGDTVRVRVRREGQRERDYVIVAEERPRGVAMREGTRVVVPGRGAPRVVIIDGDTVRIPIDSLMVHADSVQRRIRMLLVDSLGPRLRELEEVRMPELRERMRMLDTAMVRAFPEGILFEVGRRAVAGAEFSELNPELAEYFQGAREGLLVLRVAPESPAARAGLQAGDVVVSANGQAVRSTSDLRRVVGRAEREEVRIGVVRRGRQLDLRLR